MICMFVCECEFELERDSDKGTQNVTQKAFELCKKNFEQCHLTRECRAGVILDQ